MIVRDSGGAISNKIFNLLCLALLIAVILTACPVIWARESRCLELISGVQLHPDVTAHSRAVSVYRDEYGLYFNLSVGAPVPDALEVFEALGYSGFKTKMRLPHPDTMTARAQKLYPQVDVTFVAVQESTIDYTDYLRYIGLRQIPIGMKGQFYHDMIDHAVGYFLLARTPVWQPLTQHINELLLRVEQKDADAALAQKKLNRINNYFEAITPVFIMEYELGDASYQAFVEEQSAYIMRLIGNVSVSN